MASLHETIRRLAYLYFASRTWCYGRLCALCLTAVVGLSAQVNAALVADLGVLNPGDSDFFLSYEHSGSFIDDYTFQVSTESVVETRAASFNLFGLVNISDFTVAVFEGSIELPGEELGSDSGQVILLLLSGLIADTDYFLRITGVADGYLGGVYKVKYEVSAVPIPPAVVLFFSSLLFLAGYTQRRRRRHPSV